MPEQEVWKDIKGYEGAYQVSTLGRIRSLKRTFLDSRGHKQSIPDKVLKPDYKRTGYERICLSKNGKHKHFMMAKLVYETFVGPVPKGLEIDHINGTRADNRLANLRVCTHRENCNNPVSLARNIAANESRRRKLKEYWAKKKAASTM